MLRRSAHLAVLVLATCTPNRRRTPDDTLVVLIETPMTTADPRYAIIGYDRKLSHLVAPGLTIVDSPTLEAELGLASRIEPARGIDWDVDVSGAKVTAAAVVAAYRSPRWVAVEALDERIVRFRDRTGHEQLVLDQPVGALAAADFAKAVTITPHADLAYDVGIQPEAKFSDGYAVRPEDVAGTYEYLLDPKTDSLFHRTIAEKFARVIVTGPQSVRFYLKAPLATFKTDIDFGIVSFRTGTPKPGETIGAGPFVVEEMTSRHCVLVPNPHYHGVRPKMPRIEIKFVTDAAARLLMLAGGSADLIQNAMRLDLVDEVASRPRVRVESAPSVFLTYLLLNNSDPILADKRVRQAIALAVDRPAIIAAKFGGRARLASGLLPPTHWAYANDVRRWNHDLVRAKQLLDEAGHRDPDGDGPRSRFSLVYKTSSDQFRVSVARVIAGQLAAVGIDVDVRSFEFATFFADVKKGTYQIASMQTAEITEPDFYFTYFNSYWIPSAKNPDGYNRWRYINPTVDRLTAEGRRELDINKRKSIYAEVQRIVAEDVPIVPLFHEDNVVLAHVDVEGYTITPNARLIGLRDATKHVFSD